MSSRALSVAREAVVEVATAAMLGMDNVEVEVEEEEPPCWLCRLPENCCEVGSFCDAVLVSRSSTRACRP